MRHAPRTSAVRDRGRGILFGVGRRVGLGTSGVGFAQHRGPQRLRLMREKTGEGWKHGRHTHAPYVVADIPSPAPHPISVGGSLPQHICGLYVVAGGEGHLESNRVLVC